MNCFSYVRIFGYLCKYSCCPCCPTRPSWNRYFDLLINTIRVAIASQPVITMENVENYREIKPNLSADKLPRGISVVQAYDLLNGAEGLVLAYQWIYPESLNCPSFPLSTDEMDRKFILYVHGGGFIQGSADSYVHLTMKIAKETNATVIAVDYRLAPQFQYPTAELDCLAAYKWLAERVDPKNIFIAGDSAGGNLVIGTLVRARDTGLVLPRGALLLSPWVDVFDTSRESFTKYLNVDFIPARLPNVNGPLYIPSKSSECSPINLDLHGLPPMLIEYGDCEMMRDQIGDFISIASKAGVHVVGNKYDDMIHAFHFFYFTDQPQCQESFEAMKKFIDDCSTAA
jgi:epsilon-lactone hydrolase